MTGSSRYPYYYHHTSDIRIHRLQISWSSRQPNSLLTGSSLHTLQLLDLCTLTPSWQGKSPPSISQGPKSDLDTPLHAIEFLPHEIETFLTCSGGGELTLWDLRQAAAAQIFSKNPIQNISKEPQCPPNQHPTYTMAVSDQGGHCVSLSSAGELQLYGMRGASWQPQATCQLTTRAKSSLWNHFSSQKTASRPCVQVVHYTTVVQTHNR